MKISEEKKKIIDKFLEAPLIARIATVDGEGSPHVVPVWYEWDGESLWTNSFSYTNKVRRMERDPRVSVVIDTTTDNVDNRAVVLEGEVELVREPWDFIREKTTRIAIRYLGEEGLLGEEPQSWLTDESTILIKLTPEKVNSWGL